MKHMLTIGKIAKATGLSPKALRMYEELGLIRSKYRGENGYRYYEHSQLETLQRLKDFKALGFSLAEISDLLRSDSTMDTGKLKTALKRRLLLVKEHQVMLTAQRQQIEDILSSLENNNEPLGAHQRRVIMGFYGRVSIVVTGTGELRTTAEFIRGHYQSSSCDIEIFDLEVDSEVPDDKPYIFVVKEKDLHLDQVKLLHPDVVVIAGTNDSSEYLTNQYLNLFEEAGPHMTIVLNADDPGSVILASHSTVKQGRFCYFSKNPQLYRQIEDIGGLVSDGHEITIYTFNLTREPIKLKIAKSLPAEREECLLASLGAVMNIGMDQKFLNVSAIL
ncbi:MAG: MerR family transcriptional regulator [Proteobacteria bacterium]|nr:MAG: MerR family transcriptional regulator [Pseudomonadota bacterium]